MDFQLAAGQMWPLLRQRRALTRHFLDATPRTLALSYAASYALRAHHSSLSSPTPVVSPGLQEDTSHLGICVLHLACNYGLQVRRPHTYVHVSSTGTINTRVSTGERYSEPSPLTQKGPARSVFGTLEPSLSNRTSHLNSLRESPSPLQTETVRT